MKLYSRALTATEVAAVRDEVDARYSEHLGYSAIGNIADKSDQAYTYGAKPHAVTAMGPNSYTYDGNGNMTARGSQSPDGHDHWTLRLLAGKVVELGLTDSLSHEGVRKRLKKTRSSRGRRRRGAFLR